MIVLTPKFRLMCINKQAKERPLARYAELGLPLTATPDSMLCWDMDLTPTLIEKLKSHYLFAGLSDTEFGAVVAQTTLQQLPKGQILFLRGDPAKAFYFVVKGQIELAVTSPDGKKKVIEVFTAGRTFAEAIAFMREKRYPVTAQALVGTELIRIPNSCYVDVLYRNPDACMQLLSSLS